MAIQSDFALRKKNETYNLTTNNFSYLQPTVKVDGNLKVEGNIDASGNPITNVGAPQAVTDALNLQTLNNMMTDDTQYEYKTVILKLHESLPGNDDPNGYRSYKDLESSNYINSNFDDYISELSNQGYSLIQISNPIARDSHYMFLYTFKRPLEQD